jgi:hypothetical protein
VKTRRELLATIAAELTIHELIEERVLYPALKTSSTTFRKRKARCSAPPAA